MSLRIDSLSHEDASKYLDQCNIDTEKAKEILAKCPARILDLKIMCRAHWCKERAKEILREVSNLERTGVEGYREVSVYTGVYQEGRGPEAISQE
jgi:hypothetical protein